MAFAFDTLGYTKALEAAGVERSQAEARAGAARNFIMIMAELVTKTDLNDALERHTLKFTVRLGGLLIAGIGALAPLQRHPV
ncbi:hypothetical protein [Pelagibacterium halotolerans]|uniref:hypothetical protein n=1 Tax=Pelagibacterium halotolerans TaxID=531813 RepID=UPI003850E9FD